ncbi:hypothetical protein [Marihabitans asiaticum]|uniref:hypothetical protein n=1 Tax=Marihabitans asiaticum TaxID=415218 RepID=UPI0011A5ACA3|nr:hypothetical protein [Marihabitans asiaticum]
MSTAGRLAALGWAGTAANIPAMLATAAGLRSAVLWSLVGTLAAWSAALVGDRLEQHHARQRDRHLGAPDRPTLLPPAAVAAGAFVGLFAFSIGAMFLHVVFGGDLEPGFLMAVTSCVLVGTVVLTLAQRARIMRCAGRGWAQLRFLEERATPRRGVLAMMLGLVLVGLAMLLVARTATIPSGETDFAAAALMLLTAPGWLAVSAGWIMAQPTPPAAG